MLTGMTANLEHYLDLLSVRTKLVASNIANADTPGYRTQDVDFQFELQSLVNGQQAQPMDASGLTMKPDGNNVDLDRESRLLAEDAYRFNMASTLLHGNLKTVLSAITEGK
jgi:flagellar basal-body rod protein FlgB